MIDYKAIDIQKWGIEIWAVLWFVANQGLADWTDGIQHIEQAEEIECGSILLLV